MNIKGLLPQDAGYIESWLQDLSGLYDLDFAGAFLVRHSIGRILANEIRAQANRTIAEGWWNPMPRDDQLIHIIDWLQADLHDGAPWLSNIDDRGRPKKLLKCGSYDGLMREADKAVARRNAQQARPLGSDEEIFEADLGSGYTMMRLITPGALDYESLRMHHCVGHGSYDGKLMSGWTRLLSVRDGKLRPVATIELARESNGRWDIRQIRGKHNARPSRETMDILKPYAVARGWLGCAHWWPVAISSDGPEYDIDRIPCGMTVRELDASQSTVDQIGLFDLPAGLTVLGDAAIAAGITIPEHLTVHGGLALGMHDDMDFPSVLPESLHVHGDIRAWERDDIARPIPAHLYPKILVSRRKLTGRCFASMEWLDEEVALANAEEQERAPGP